ncbi:multidrug efflux MFS transporter Cmr [Corynebacterium glutamicum]|uniref:multidrug efflux MFS transporter Cmr n=1 Tax=Corynebacterium glutamicum TaxID=1718 RepID=UPI00117E945F|nr:multidrug efflux MFS transporter Cmr [Corynebacterium glutamicum]QDQ19347.1 multidrug efflux MFS transporter Cmr [Corynebacterium glutamicum]QDQ22911.1 multidrug efflux MFS transporter Cmr [Corynebacterium glutamicum]
MSTFHKVLINTMISNVTTGFLFFAVVFWMYLSTGNVALTGIVSGIYMGLIAVCSIFFGTVVDHNRKKSVMLFSSVTTLVFYCLSALVWVFWLEEDGLSIGNTALWVFVSFILIGSIVEHMRNIALSTVVTLLVPEAERDKANGLVGAVQGVGFLVTSVIAGSAIGFLGMEITLWICLGLSLVALLHLLPIRIDEPEIITQEDAQTAIADDSVPTPASDLAIVSKGIDLKGSMKIILSVPGLLALVLFASFNNLIGGVYSALMDPYGLELFSPQLWGLLLGLTSLGFIVGGAVISKTGLGKNPVRTLLLVNVGVAFVGMFFAIREWWWLYILGIFIFMAITPAAEAAEQTILQRVVPFRQQGRVFGLAMAVEMAANPLSTVIVAILAEAYLIPWMAGPGADTIWGVILGDGKARGMALMFLASGAIMLVVVLLAFMSRSYRKLSQYYATTSQDIAGAAEK